MDNKIEYTKLTALVDQEFKVLKGKGYHFQHWDNEARQMKKEDKWFEGSEKKYTLETDKGELTVGTGQLGSLLQEVYKDGKADINGVTFHVKSNGKTGMDIRYFFNVVRDTPPVQQTEIRDTYPPVADNEPIDLDDIPF